MSDKHLDSGATDKLAISYDATALSAGSYSGNIFVSTTTGVVKSIPVALTVNQASIATSLGSGLQLTQSCVVGYQPSPPTQSVQLWNGDSSGLTVLNYNLFVNQA